jgi:hypothetical protein
MISSSEIETPWPSSLLPFFDGDVELTVPFPKLLLFAGLE